MKRYGSGLSALLLLEHIKKGLESFGTKRYGDPVGFSGSFRTLEPNYTGGYFQLPIREYMMANTETRSYHARYATSAAILCTPPSSFPDRQVYKGGQR